MKIPVSYPRNRGLTLFETVIVVFALVVIIAILFPRPTNAHANGPRIHCMNNLKQLGLAFRIWSGDNNDKYPMAVSVTNGGAMEAIQGGAPLVVFQVMSNELSTPKILFCPADDKHDYATNFGPSLSAQNVSYFANSDISNEFSAGFASGDDNLETNSFPLKSGISLVLSNTPLGWTAARHKSAGNLMMADGSGQSMNNSGLTQWLLSTNVSTPFHLAIP
jgi:hypothetical protein